ncbi:MAG: hypothetical protein M1831_005517 [Alyxoria varia]|nr:MAG: hypothetical protein M1831_005517 [Alyxoria varia]
MSVFSRSPGVYAPGECQAAWSFEQFENLVVFGDSYSDENQLNYFALHNDSAPPVGTLFPETFEGYDGGRVWTRYVVQYSEQKTTLYDYAVAGAVCSNQITPRYEEVLNGLFPDLDGYEVPQFLADKQKDVNIATGGPFFTPSITHDNTVYAFFDGTNDIGKDAFFTDSQVPGNTLDDYVDCIFRQMDRVYESGARYFVLMNIAPLQLSPMYANASYGGVPKLQYWTDKPDNLTAISLKMEQFVDLVNTIFQYRTPYETLIARRYPDAKVALFDVNKLFFDIYTHPLQYLNGTTPPKVDRFINHCNLDSTNCSRASDPDSYVWYDELHPSEQVDRVIAREFTNVLSGTSQFAQYFGQ